MPAPTGPMLFLSVVMPAYNEEASIEAVVREHLVVMSTLPPIVTDWEIVVLDDGSRDRTADILRQLAQQHPRIRVSVHSVNEGLFRSFDDVHRAARGTHVYSTGSDGQWPASNLPRLLNALLEHRADLVVGVRPNRYEVYTPWRRLVSRCYQLLPRILFGIQIHDAGSIKLGRRELFQCRLISRSPFAEAERIIRAIRTGHRVDFVPIEFLPRTTGKARGAKLSYVLGAVLDCLRCFWGYRVNRRIP